MKSISDSAAMGKEGVGTMRNLTVEEFRTKKSHVKEALL
jgi:hypothetical protein